MTSSFSLIPQKISLFALSCAILISQAAFAESELEIEQSTSVVEQAIEANAQLNSHVSCKSCGTNHVTPAVRCSGDSYFNELFSPHTRENPIADLATDTEENPHLQRCISESMNQVGNHFRTCDGKDNFHESRKDARVCSQSTNVLKTVQASFSASIDCLTPYLTGIKSNEAVYPLTKASLEKNLFSLIAQESGFNYNAVSATGAAGLMQMTTGAVDAVNKNIWKDMTAAIAASNDPSCKRIAAVQIQEVKPTVAAKCGLIDAQAGNPLRSLLYGLGYQKLSRQYLERGLQSLARKSAILRSINVREDVREEFYQAITLWAHNAGPGIIKEVKFLLSTERGRKMLEDGHVDQFMDALKAVVRSYNQRSCDSQSTRCRSLARAREVMNYYQDLKHRSKTIDQLAGSNQENSCGI